MKSILITGCSSGIGAHVAIQLQSRGYRVFASARNPEDVARLQSQGLETLQLDLDDSNSIKNAATEVLARCDSKLYALFNNAGFGLPGAVEDIPREGMRQQFETNLFGPIELINHLLPAMRQTGEGRIIQHSSVLGIAAFPFRGAYVASKFALEGITDTLRLELKGSGIHVSLIEPGPIESKFRSNAHAAYQKFINKDNSFFKSNYESMEARLKIEGPAAPFTETPESVYKRVIHALESKHPQARYYVTKPTYIFGALKRILPSKIMDTILIKASGEGKR